jgi:hypothetical protein
LMVDDSLTWNNHIDQLISNWTLHVMQ